MKNGLTCKDLKEGKYLIIIQSPDLQQQVVVSEKGNAEIVNFNEDEIKNFGDDVAFSTDQSSAVFDALYAAQHNPELIPNEEFLSVLYASVLEKADKGSF